MLVNDFIELTLETTLPNASNPCLNVHHFQVGVLSESVSLFQVGQEIAEAFLARYRGPILALLSTQSVFTGVRLRNLNNPEEGFDLFGVLGTGTNSSGMLPPMVTLSIREQRTDYSMRNGRKGISGVALPVCDSTGKVSPSSLVLFEDVAEAWSTTDFVIEAGDVNMTLVDVVIRKPSVTGAPPTKFYYIDTWSLSPKFGTQNSRK